MYIQSFPLASEEIKYFKHKSKYYRFHLINVSISFKHEATAQLLWISRSAV